MAEIYMKKGNLVKAKEILKEFVLNFDRTHYVNVASKYLGDISRKEGKSKEAIKYYEKALDNRRGDFNANIQYEIGRLYSDIENFEDAVAAFMKVAYIYPDSTNVVVESQLDCAKIFEGQKKWADAEKLYTKIAVMDVKESTYARERISWIRRNKK
jgi:tetratricopeptide (TPR) repeat protein